MQAVQVTGELMRQHLAHKAIRTRIAEAARQRQIALEFQMQQRAFLQKNPILSYVATKKGFLSEESHAWRINPEVDLGLVNYQRAMSTGQFMRRTVRIVAEGENISPRDIMSPRRSHNIVIARFMAINIFLEMTGYSLPRIGRFLGRDHTSILAARDSFIRSLANNPALGERLEVYKRQLRPIAPKFQISESVTESAPINAGWMVADA